MGEDDLISLISFLDSRLVIDVYLAEMDLIPNFPSLGVASLVLRLSINLDNWVLRDDVLDGVKDESIERSSLLRNKSVLLEVRPDDCPGVLLSNLILALLDIHI